MATQAYVVMFHNDEGTRVVCVAASEELANNAIKQDAEEIGMMLGLALPVTFIQTEDDKPGAYCERLGDGSYWEINVSEFVK